MTVSLSKITALEAAVEYLIKATAGEEQREYDPEGFHEGPRHGHYFKPGEREVGGKEVEVVQAPELPKSDIEIERDRQHNQATELEALNLVHPEDIIDGGYNNVIKWSDANDLIESNLLNENGATAENLYEKAKELGLDKVTVWHGTTGKGATGILTDGAIDPAKTGGAFGAGFNMSPKAASSWAGGKAIGSELKHSVDRLPMIIQFDISVDLLKDIKHDQSFDAYSIEDHKVTIPLDLETTKILYSDDPDNPYPNRKFNLLNETFSGIPRNLLKKVDQNTDNLSKLLVLETALDYLSKADTGKREYLAPGEKAPEGLREYPGSRPGVRYYMPGSAGAKEDEALPDLAPGEEREIQVVSPSDVSEVGTEEEIIEDPAERARTLFESISKDLEGVLSSISPDYQQFLGTPIDDSRLTADNLEHVGFTDGTFEGTTSPSGLGINSEFNFTVSIDGKPFIYKVAPGENRSEQLCYSVDRALGLNIVPYVKPYNMDIDKLHKAFKKAHRSSVVDKILLMPSEKVEIDKYTLNELESRTGGHRKYQAENQTEEQKTSLLPGGHFMEFCETCPDKEESAGIMAEMLTLKEGREEFFKLMLLDFITGNDDRHAGNWMVTKDKKAVAIDSGFAGGGGEGRSYLSIGQNARGMKLDFPWRVREALTAHIMDLGLDDNEAQDYRSHLKDRDILKSEADGVFDKYYDAEKIQKALDPLHWNSAAAARYDQQSDLKDTFREYAASYLELAMQAPYKNEGLLNTSDRVAQGLTPPKETPKFKPIEQLAWGQDKPKGLLNRFRDWVGVGAKSSNVELDPAKMTPLDRL